MTYAEILTEVEDFINANTERQHRTFSRGMLLQLMAKYHQQKLQQCHVSGWLELAEQEPKPGQKVVFNPKDWNMCSLDTYNPMEFPEALKAKYRWIPVPAFR